MKKPLPSAQIQIVDAHGRPTVEFYEWLMSVDRMRLSDLRDVDVSGATDGQQLTFGSGKWSPDSA